jgi:hypothetical protein
MPAVTRKELIDTLNREWGTYVERYRNFSKEGKMRFVQKQGFARFGDLLAHFIAWWEEGIKALESMTGDPSYRPPDYSVDEFNAKAVARFAAKDEDAIAGAFEDLRQRLVRLVADLPESAFLEKRITDRLHVEIIGHLTEHSFEAD